MAINEQRPMRSVGVGPQYICFAEDTATTPPTYETDVTKMCTVSTIETTEERSVTPVYASNIIYDEDVANKPPTLVVENVAFPADILAKARGSNVSGAYVTRSTFDAGKYFAYGVVYPRKKGFIEYVWYPKCLLVDSPHSAQTKDDAGPNSQNRTINIQVMEFDASGNYEVKYDTVLLTEGQAPVTEEAFFSTVKLGPATEPTEP